MKITKQLTWASGSLLFAALLVFSPTMLSADGCYNCASGSSCGNQCRYGSSDTFAKRKECEKKGCKITGTSSCSTAANVKVCLKPAPKKDFWSSIFEVPVFSIGS